MPTASCVCGEQVAEPVAVTEDFDHRTSADTYLVLQCGACGSLRLSLVPEVESTARIYPDGYASPAAARAKIDPAPGTGVLDLSAPLRRETIEKADRQPLQYEHAVLAWTLEHVPDPVATLSAVATILQPGGPIRILLHNLRSPTISLFKGRHWGGYDAPRQRRVLSVEGVRHLASRAGLEVTEVSTRATADVWTRSLRRLCADWHAPTWLGNRFAMGGLASAMLGTLDALLRPLGRSSLLLVTLRRSGTRLP
jgi:hypothetical protein